jgi:F0F1-type ATP synthase assembly protein I
MMRFSAAMSSAVLVKAFLIFAGYWIGTKVDVALGTKPLFMIVLALVGVCLGLWWLLFIAGRAKRILDARSEGE